MSEDPSAKDAHALSYCSLFVGSLELTPRFQNLLQRGVRCPSLALTNSEAAVSGSGDISSSWSTLYKHSLPTPLVITAFQRVIDSALKRSMEAKLEMIRSCNAFGRTKFVIKFEPASGALEVVSADSNFGEVFGVEAALVRGLSFADITGPQTSPAAFARLKDALLGTYSDDIDKVVLYRQTHHLRIPLLARIVLTTLTTTLQPGTWQHPRRTRVGVVTVHSCAGITQAVVGDEEKLE